MADFNALEALINAYIKQNGVKAITGNILNGVLRGMVSALGKGWTIADGDATPTTDPGTMTGPVAYIAHTAGTYEHFGNLVVNEGEVALLKYNEQTWTKEVIASLAATASVDGNVGTPAVDVTFQNGVLSFDFRNMKGNPGNDGDAAGFGTVNATVDANIGTPGVSVQTSGPDTAKNMTFAFTNLKGETGVTSVVATVDNTVGTPSCAVSLVGQELHLDFTGLKGPQGDTGSSVDYPFTIVNNLTTNDATQALSAAMGVQLESEISQLEHKVSDALDLHSTTGEVTEIVPYEQNSGYIASYNAIVNDSTDVKRRYSNPIFLKSGETLKIKGITATNIGRLASYNPDTRAVTVIVMGQSSGTNSATYAYENTYTATADIYLIVGWNWDYYLLELTKTYQKTTTTSKLDVIDTITEILDIQEESGTVVESVEATTTSGSYYLCTTAFADAILNNGSAYSYTSQFFIKEGEKITVTTKNAATNVAILASVEGTRFRGIVLGNNSDQTAEYIAPMDGYYIVSFKTSEGVTITKSYTKSGYDSTWADNVDTEIEKIPSLESDISEVYSQVNSEVDDDMTTVTVSGKYITHSGELATNESFSYKEFNVRAGAVVVFTGQMNPNIAAISKKLTVSTFEELVPGATYTTETFNYTATEDMTMVVCFMNTYSRHITIDTDLVESNHISINVIYERQNEAEQSAIVQDIDFGFMFNKIAVIGDSLASGRVEGIVGEPDEAGADYYGFSWLTFLSKRWRCEKQKNYSNAAATTASWISTWLPVMQADSDVYDAYFIALGTNNEYNEGNPSGDQANFDAFVERYNDIIDAVRTKAPHAAIFIMSLYEKRAGYGNATLQDIAETRALTDDGVFYLDYADEAEYKRYSPEVNWRGHFSSDGYAYVASAINQIVNRIVWDNKTEEFWVQFAKYHNGS